MLKQKYQVRFEIAETDSWTKIEAVFARPFEQTILDGIKALFEPYNFTVELGTNMQKGGNDPQKIKIFADAAYELESILDELVQFLEKENYSSFYFSRAVPYSTKQGYTIKSILDDKSST